MHAAQHAITNLQSALAIVPILKEHDPKLEILVLPGPLFCSIVEENLLREEKVVWYTPSYIVHGYYRSEYLYMYGVKIYSARGKETDGMRFNHQAAQGLALNPFTYGGVTLANAVTGSGNIVKNNP